MKPLVIWGCGGHAREINWLCQQIGYEVIGFLDERAEMKGQIVNDIPVLGDLPDIKAQRGKVDIVCAGVGDPTLKERFVHKTVKAGFQPAKSLIHPNITISKRNRIGIGCIICEGTILTDNIDIGNFVVINRGVHISHDVLIGDFTTIAPGVNIAGNVSIGERVYVGIGASVRENKTIGNNAVIGGGAFVKEDVPAKALAAGVPAQIKKYYEEKS
jgi:sugar O-acyltransferase (sialic acid O-acetyltransferase NeuD family)